MFKATCFPVFWSVRELVFHGDDVIYDLARQSTGTLTSCKVLLGRCLLAAEETKLYEKFAMSSVIGFARAALGLSQKEAYTYRRVARELQELPLLTQAAEKGEVSWSKLREVVSVATPETEELWLKICGEFTCGQVQTLVSLTPHGGVPGDLPEEKTSHGSEYRCRFSPELVVIIERVLQQRSQKEGRALSFAEAVELLFTEALLGKPFDEAQEKLRVEQHREHLAEQLSQHSLVTQAQKILQEFHENDTLESWSHVGTGEPSGEEGLLEEKAPAAWSHVGTTKLCEDTEHNGDPLENSSHVGPTESTARNSDTNSSSHTADCCSSDICTHNLLEQALGHLRFNPDNRLPTAAQRKALLRRDRYRCQTPGCPHHRLLHLHHITWHSQNGTTEAENLVTLCTACHKKVHEGQLQVSGTPQTGLVFSDAQGRRLDRAHRLETAAWLDYWIGWSGEEHDRHQGKVAI